MVEGSRRPRNTGYGDKKESTRAGASRHAKKYGKFGVDLYELVKIEGGGGASYTSCTAKKEGGRSRAS
jgi:hypothetical protein